MKLTRAQLNAIKKKARENKAVESNEQADDTPASTQSLQDIKKILAQKKEEESKTNPIPSKKSQLKAVKRQARGLARNQKPTKVNWNCSIGDLVHIPERWSGVGESLYGIVVKMAEDNRSGRRSVIANDSTQVQVLTSGGFRWYYVKSLRTV